VESIAVRRNRVRQCQTLRHACGDRHGPVDPRRDQAVDPLGAGQPLDARLVLGRDDCPAVGVAEAGRGWFPVNGDHMELTRPCRRQEAELRGSSA